MSANPKEVFVWMLRNVGRGAQDEEIKETLGV
jgi:hypothetical protein